MDFNVIAASPVWSLNGVNVFSANLVRGMRAFGIPAHILLTRQTQPDFKPMPLVSDVPVEHLSVRNEDNWKARWHAMVRYLEERAPCIYIPNYDFDHSCVSPKLSNRVGIVGIVHSDDPQHYEHVSRLGKYWNAIVAVSKAVCHKTVSLDPTLSQRLITISHGVSIPNHLPRRPLDSNSRLKMVYAGRLVQRQKRILDLVKIAEALLAQHIPFELTIIGGGSDQDRFLAASKDLIEQGVIRFLGILPNEMVLEILEQNDVFLMTSEFEGMPLTLIEAMGRGCVPVVTDIESGVRELVRNHVNGFLIPVGAIESFAERLAMLQGDVGWCQKLSLNAYGTVDKGGYRVQDMVLQYIELFHLVLREAESGVYRRPRGPIVPPPSLRISWKEHIPLPLRAVARRVKRHFLELSHR